MMVGMDIGNTAITVAALRGRRVWREWVVPTDASQADAGHRLKQMRKEWQNAYIHPQAIVMCSVVPAAQKRMTTVLKRMFDCPLLVIGKDMNVPLKNHYRDPRQVGQDRLVGAYAALQLYGAPVIIVDLGTAITFDVVSRENVYLGGIIVPGIRLSAESLYRKTALLPQIDIHRPPALIGRDTAGSILSGLFYGYGEMIAGLVSLLRRQTGKDSKVVLTGGYAYLMKKYVSSHIDGIERHLVMKGLYLLAKNRK